MKLSVLLNETSPKKICAYALPSIVLVLVACVFIAGCTGGGTPTGRNENPQTTGYIQKAWALNAEAKFQEADRMADQAIALDPDNPDALAMRGWARAGLGRYQEALTALDSSIVNNPDNAIVWSNKGFSLYNLGRCEEAVQAFDRALERDPYDLGAEKYRTLAKGKCPTQAAPVTTAQPAQAASRVTDNFNSNGVNSGAACEPQFTFGRPVKILTITNYHYHNGKGDIPGTISLEHTGTNKTYGPYVATGADGQGGVKNAFWTVKPETVVPAGTYFIRDSNPATWSQNDQTGKCGMSQISYVEVTS
jgi:hypothetical protein